MLLPESELEIARQEAEKAVRSLYIRLHSANCWMGCTSSPSNWAPNAISLLSEVFKRWNTSPYSVQIDQEFPNRFNGGNK